MAFNDFTVEDQWKIISKNLTWQEFKGKCYIKAENGGSIRRQIQKMYKENPGRSARNFSKTVFKPEI